MYSFDVFDTLITRATATPKGVYALMQHILKEEKQNDFNTYVKTNFFSLRIGAEQVARNTYCIDGIEEVTLEQIYEVLVREHLITKEQAKYLCRLEQEQELAVVHGIPCNIEKVKKLVAKGEQVILISDMYLDAKTIHAMLTKVDTIFSSLSLYVSSEKEKKGKWTGNLFCYIKGQENVSYQEWHHCGDNKDFDYRIPKGLGILCELYKPEELLEVEEEYIRNNEAEAYIQLSIGCARLARMYGRKNRAYRMGSSLGGSILYPYVNWLLEDARKRGIQHLYFVARDGYILKELADILIGFRKLEIKTSYLYGSRLAWRIPEGKDWKEEQMAIYWSSFGFMIKNASDFAEFLQITEENLLPYLPKGLRQPDKIWTSSTVETILEHLLLDIDFSTLLYQNYQEKKKWVIAYIKQEIDIKESFAFVDLAGTGFTQECLVKMMREYYNGEAQNYFYRRDNVRGVECKNYVFYPYYVSYYVLLEMMCRAPHGQTIGYQKNPEGRIEPILSMVDGEAIKEHGVPEFIQGAKEFTALYEETLKNYQDLVLENSQIQFYLDYIYDRPNQETLEYFAEIPNMLTGREKRIRKFAPKLTNREICHLFLLQDKPVEQEYYGSDLRYSLLRCSKRQKKQITRYQAMNSRWYGKVRKELYFYFHRKERKIKRITLLDFLDHRVVVYGAGKKGRVFYQQVTGKVKVNGRKYCSEVVLWIDQNVEQYQKEGLPVVGVERVRSAAYDQLVIAIAKKETAEKVKQMLLTYGVPEEKIFWVYDC